MKISELVFMFLFCLFLLTVCLFKYGGIQERRISKIDMKKGLEYQRPYGVELWSTSTGPFFRTCGYKEPHTEVVCVFAMITRKEIK